MAAESVRHVFDGIASALIGLGERGHSRVQATYLAAVVFAGDFDAARGHVDDLRIRAPLLESWREVDGGRHVMVGNRRKDRHGGQAQVAASRCDGREATTANWMVGFTEAVCRTG